MRKLEKIHIFLFIICFVFIFIYTSRIEYLFPSKVICFIVNIITVIIPYSLYKLYSNINSKNFSKKNLFQASVISIFFALFMIYSLNIYKHNPQNTVDIEVSATHQKYEKSKGYNVELFSVKADNYIVPFDKIEKSKNVTEIPNNSYKEKEKSLKLLSNNEYLNPSIKIKTKADKLYFIFHACESFGIAKIKVNDKTYLFDTYIPGYEENHNPYDSNQLITISANDNLSFSILLLKYLHICSYFIIFFMIFQYLALIILSKQINIHRSLKKVSIYSFVLYALPIFTGGLIALVIFYPLILPFDGLTQWKYAHTMNFCNEHPVIHSYFIHLLTKIWDNPAIIGITQILTISFLTGYFLFKLEQHGIPQKILIICSLIIGFTPYNTVMSVSLWKDVLYSYFIFSLTLSALLICIEKDDFFNSKINNIIFCISLVLSTMIRYNGFLTVMLFLAILMICFRKQLKQLFIHFTIYVLSVIVLTIFANHITVYDQSFIHNQAVEVPIHQIQAVFHYGGKVTDEQKSKLNEFAPVYKFEKFYTKYYVHNFIFSAKELKNEKIDIIKFLKVYFYILKEKNNLKIMAKDFLGINSYILKFGLNPENISYTQPCALWIENHREISQIYNVSDNNLRQINSNTDLFKKVTNLFNNHQQIVYNPYIPFLLVLFFGFILLIRNGIKSSVILIPSLASVFFISISLPEMCPRYVFYLFLLSPIIILLSLVNIKCSENTGKNEFE